MLKPKAKGLFVDISEFSILAAQTSGYESPVVVEEIAEFPIKDDFSSEDVRAFLGRLVDLKKGNYVAHCGAYPKDRFIRYHEVESGTRLKNQNFLQKLLKSELNIDPETNNISILNVHDGSQFDSTKNVTNELIFCGASTASLQETQDRILSYGLLPRRVELSSVAILGGVCNYAQLNQLESSFMCIELSSDCTHIFILNKSKVEMIRSLEFGLDSLYPILQDELGLQDEASARKLFRSNTFDVAEIGRKLLNKILKELQAISGYYEVQTGLPIEHFFVSSLPPKLNWIPDTISNALGIDLMQIEMEPWLQDLEIRLGDAVDVSELESQWFGIFSLMGVLSKGRAIA